MTMTCPHCEQASTEEAWPFCSYCQLFVIDIEELNLSPEALLSAWRCNRKIDLLQ
jgi:hypothetical protein